MLDKETLAVLALRMLRISLSPLLRPSRKYTLVKRQRSSLQTSRLLAQKPRLSNFISILLAAKVHFVPLVLRTRAHLTVSRHGAICASVLVSELPDTLSLDYKKNGHLLTVLFLLSSLCVTLLPKCYAILP